MDNVNVPRFVGDTWPIAATIKVDGNVVNFGDSHVYMYYEDVDGDGNPEMIKVESVLGSEGRAKFYPRARYGRDLTNAVDYVPFTNVGVYDYSIVRETLVYEADVNGNYVMLNGVPTTYDSVVHLSNKRYVAFNDVMTHAVGQITISDRVGV